MKKTGRRLTALALALVLALGMVQTAFASWALGTELAERTVPLAQGTDFTTQSLWSASKNDLRTEHYITYTPGGGVKPVVFSGSYVASTNPVATAAAQLKSQGYRVAAAINGGFFNQDGTIVGLLVTDGTVRSLDVENYTLLGFTND
ncbi:MAG: surface layer protein, partial [Oscillospiraceae bacterium]|nr:surface layer protein [Oscillospiraceae bacterium]